VPVAVQVEPGTVPPPSADPLHCVIVAPVVLAGVGSQMIMLPAPLQEPTHWFTVAAVAPVLRPMNLLVTTTLQRRVPPPPLIEALHWLTDVTSLVRLLTVVTQGAGTAADPRHTWIVTREDPPVPLIVLTTVTRQISPWPPALRTPLPHVVVGPAVAALAPPANAREPTSSSPEARRIEMERRTAIT
jgi:hypothetical protein